MPKPSHHLLFIGLAHAHQAMRERGVDPARVSLACLMGQHQYCVDKGGRITLPREVEGYRYDACGCPECEHPPLNTRRTHTAPRTHPTAQ